MSVATESDQGNLFDAVAEPFFYCGGSIPLLENTELGAGSEEVQAKNDIMLPKSWLKKLGGGTAILVLGMMIGYRAPDDIERTRVHIDRKFAEGCARALGCSKRAVHKAIPTLIAKFAVRKDPEGFYTFLMLTGGEVDPDEWRTDAIYLPRGVAMCGGSRQGGLTAEGKCVWAAIWMISKRERGQCDARVDTIAEEAGVSERTARDWLPRLRQFGGIAYANRKHLNKDRYVIRYESVQPDISKWIAEKAKRTFCPPEREHFAPQKGCKENILPPEREHFAPEETSVRDVREERDVKQETSLRPASLRSVSAKLSETEPKPLSGISDLDREFPRGDPIPSGTAKSSEISDVSPDRSREYQRLRPVPTFPYVSDIKTEEPKAEEAPVAPFEWADDPGVPTRNEEPFRGQPEAKERVRHPATPMLAREKVLQRQAVRQAGPLNPVELESWKASWFGAWKRVDPARAFASFGGKPSFTAMELQNLRTTRTMHSSDEINLVLDYLVSNWKAVSAKYHYAGDPGVNLLRSALFPTWLKAAKLFRQHSKTFAEYNAWFAANPGDPYPPEALEREYQKAKELLETL